MYKGEYGSKEKEMEVFRTHSQDTQRASLCHSTLLDTYGQEESWPPQNNLALYCGERDGNGRLEVCWKQELWLRIGASGREAVQQSEKKIGEAR